MCGSSRSNSTKTRATPAPNRGRRVPPAARKRASSCTSPMCHTSGTDAPPLSTSTSTPQVTFSTRHLATSRKLRQIISYVPWLLAARNPRSLVPFLLCVCGAQRHRRQLQISTRRTAIGTAPRYVRGRPRAHSARVVRSRSAHYTPSCSTAHRRLTLRHALCFGRSGYVLVFCDLIPGPD